MNQRRLTDNERAELDALNESVSAAIQIRREWLDAKMHETSQLQPGDAIYDLATGRQLGIVRRLYRYHADGNQLYDDSPSCSYEYGTGNNCYDNTSRQPGLSFGTREEALQRAEAYAARLRGETASGE